MPDGLADLAAFLDREAATAVVLSYADALDSRDWSAFRSLFCDELMIDYGAIGSIFGLITADAWTDRCRLLEGFSSTAHRIHNLRVTIVGDRATVSSIVDAAHFAEVDGEQISGDLIGRYTHMLHRDSGWKIAGVALDVIGHPAGRAAFERAFSAARATHSEGRLR